MSEKEDEQSIRGLIGAWMRATAEGDVDGLLGLMAEDVVFLLPGQQAMRGRETFATGFRSMAGKIRFEGRPDVQEITVAGDYAFCWNFLSVTVTPLPDGPAQKRAGNILSVFRRESDGRWVLFRDANMLTKV